MAGTKAHTTAHLLTFSATWTRPCMLALTSVAKICRVSALFVDPLPIPSHWRPLLGPGIGGLSQTSQPAKMLRPNKSQPTKILTYLPMPTRRPNKQHTNQATKQQPNEEPTNLQPAHHPKHRTTHRQTKQPTTHRLTSQPNYPAALDASDSCRPGALLGQTQQHLAISFACVYSCKHI